MGTVVLSCSGSDGGESVWGMGGTLLEVPFVALVLPLRVVRLERNDIWWWLGEKELRRAKRPYIPCDHHDAWRLFCLPKVIRNGAS